jgi:acetyl-CoA synthetase
VRECAVLGAQLEDGRMSLEAFVVLNAGQRGDDDMTRRLTDYVKKMLLPYKYPRIIRYLDQLPKTGTGKIDRQALAAPNRDASGSGPG